ATNVLKSGADDYIVRDADGAWLELLPIVVERQFQKRQLIDERKQAVRLADQHNQRLALLNKACQALTEPAALDAIVGEMAKAAVQIVGAAEASVWLWTSEAKTLLRSRGVYRDGQFDPNVIVDISPEQGVIGQVARAARSFSVACTVAE